METPYGKVMPPSEGFGKRADGGAGEATAPMIVDVRSELVAGEPVDFVFFNAVENHFIAERDAVGGTGVGAFPADLAEILYADVHGFVRHQRQVGQDRVRHVDAGAVGFIDHETVSPQLADTGRYSRGLWSYHAT